MKLKVLFLTFCILNIVEAKPPVLTIDELVQITLKHSPQIEIGRLDFSAAQERMKFTKGAYLPRLDVSLEAGKQYSRLKHQEENNIDVLRGGIGVSQLLYDFGKTSGRVTGTTQEAFALEAQMQQIISDKILAVKQTYYKILKSKSIIDVQVKNVELQKQQLYRTQRYLESGIKTIIDVSDAKVQVEQAQLELKNAKYDLELQRAALEEVLGYVPNEGNYQVYSQTLSLKNLSKKLSPIGTSLKELETFAYKHRYVVEASKYYVHGAKSQIDVLKSEYYPILSLHGNYQAQQVDNTLLEIAPVRQGQISVNVTWNIFSGYQTDTAVQEAKIGVLKSSSQVKSVMLSVKREVLESYILVRQSFDNVMLFQSISHASLKKYEQAKKRYENELSDYIEFQDAQQGYIQSLAELVNAYYDYFIAMAKLDHAIGR